MGLTGPFDQPLLVDSALGIPDSNVVWEQPIIVFPSLKDCTHIQMFPDANGHISRLSSSQHHVRQQHEAAIVL